VRRLAAATAISPTTVHRIWRDHKLKPHQVRSFKFSKDPQLTEKIIDSCSSPEPEKPARLAISCASASRWCRRDTPSTC
jgi:hypothetical protein